MQTRRRYSCDVIKTLQATEPLAAQLQKLLPQRLFADTPGSADYTLHEYASFMAMMAFNKAY